MSAGIERAEEGSPAKGPGDAAPNAKLGRSLALLLGGQEKEGFELYRKALNGDHLSSAPVGIHLQLLRSAGRHGTADQLLKLALREGANVALRAGGFGAKPAQAAAEYEQLFASSILNSRMVHEYLLVLAQQQRVDALQRILEPNVLLHTSFPQPPEEDPQEFASKVEALLLELQDRAEAQEAVQSVRRMRMIKDFDRLEHPVATRLMQCLASEVQDYLQKWRASAHPFAHLVPAEFTLGAWGLVSQGDGYNSRHIHQHGWATGIYYPTAIGDGDGGQLAIGPPENAAEGGAGWPTAMIRPEAGLLVLIPSFYTHWTVPLGRPGLRTSIAFDVLP